MKSPLLLIAWKKHSNAFTWSRTASHLFGIYWPFGHLALDPCSWGHQESRIYRQHLKALVLQKSAKIVILRNSTPTPPAWHSFFQLDVSGALKFLCSHFSTRCFGSKGLHPVFCLCLLFSLVFTLKLFIFLESVTCFTFIMLREDSWEDQWGNEERKSLLEKSESLLRYKPVCRPHTSFLLAWLPGELPKTTRFNDGADSFLGRFWLRQRFFFKE